MSDGIKLTLNPFEGNETANTAAAAEAAQEEEKKVEAAKQLIDLICRNELAAQKVLDVNNSRRILLGRWKMTEKDL